MEVIGPPTPVGYAMAVDNAALWPFTCSLGSWFLVLDATF
jgi:hypothetical protein